MNVMVMMKAENMETKEFWKSAERWVNGRKSLANGFTPEEGVGGLHFEIANWHAKKQVFGGPLYLISHTCMLARLRAHVWLFILYFY